MAGRKSRQIKNRKKNRRTIVRFPSGLHLNIGIVTFLFIAFYISFNIYSYFTAVHVSSYEVEQGTIEVNTSFTGLILRQETVVNASQSGQLDYYLKDNTKASNGTLICSIDENGSVSDKLNAAADTSAVMSKDNLTDIQNTIREYTAGYHDSAYYTTYNFKSDLSGKLMEAVNLGALNTISDYTDFARDNKTFHLYRAQQPGVAAYYTDGLESATVDTITEDMFNQSSYQKNSMKTAGTIESGQPLYKLITDENWQIVIPLDDAMKKLLPEDQAVKIRFKEDNTTAWANYTTKQKAGRSYLVLDLHNSMIRYAYERYIDIHILLDQQTGLKIPNSSITTKTFELVPDEYFTRGNGNSDQSGLMVEHKLEDGTYSDAEFVPVAVYYHFEEEDEHTKEKKQWSCISQNDIQAGDLILKEESTQRYEIASTKELKGVYNINKGYAVFRRIEELYHNDDYTIVESGTESGIMLYDYIALEGNTVLEDQMINR